MSVYNNQSIKSTASQHNYADIGGYSSFADMSEFQKNQLNPEFIQKKYSGVKMKSTLTNSLEGLSKKCSELGNSIRKLNPLKTSFIAYLSSFDLSKSTTAFTKVKNEIFSSIFNRFSSNNSELDKDPVGNTTKKQTISHNTGGPNPYDTAGAFL